MNKKIERIGIFGGSFNPIHKGHVEMAKIAIERLNLDFLYIVPVGIPSHRSGKNFASGEDRMEMLRLTFNKNPKVIPYDYEVLSHRVSYTYDTLLKIKEDHPNSVIFEIIGEDSAEYLHTWKNYEKMLTLCKFAYFKRKGSNFTSTELIAIDAPLFNMSSTMIRDKIKNHESVRKYLNHEVEEYIKKNKLYRGIS